MRLHEVLSFPTSSLWRYLQNKTIGTAHGLAAFIEWIQNELEGENEEDFEKVQSYIKQHAIDLDELDWSQFEDIYNLFSDYTKENFLYWYSNYRNTGGSEFEPWTMLDPQNRLRRDTWLIHFSKDADSIWQEGFKTGTPEYDLERLALSTHFERSDPGYNFAFEAGTRQSLNGVNKYGDEAVMFQSSGIAAYHYGDEEHQVIFWGPDVQPRDLVLIRNDGGDWAVAGNDKWRAVNNDRAGVYVNEDLLKVQQWVIDNWDQYRNVLAGG